MRYLIDTNIFIFLCFNTDELEPKVKEILDDCENQIIISSESVREIAMLLKGGKIRAKKPWQFFAEVKEAVDSFGFEIRYVSEAHLRKLYELKPAPRHSDPADLMIIAQALAEDLPLISSDTDFPFYRDQGLKFIYNRR